MIQEVYETEGGSIDAIYDFETFLENRYSLQNQWPGIKKPGVTNPFIPDMPTRHIGYVKITESTEAVGYILESTENDLFSNFGACKVGKVNGTVFASLSTIESDGSYNITISIENVVGLSSEASSIIILSYVDPYGI